MKPPAMIKAWDGRPPEDAEDLFVTDVVVQPAEEELEEEQQVDDRCVDPDEHQPGDVDNDSFMDVNAETAIDQPGNDEAPAKEVRAATKPRPKKHNARFGISRLCVKAEPVKAEPVNIVKELVDDAGGADGVQEPDVHVHCETRTTRATWPQFRAWRRHCGEGTDEDDWVVFVGEIHAGRFVLKRDGMITIQVSVDLEDGLMVAVSPLF